MSSYSTTPLVKGLREVNMIDLVEEAVEEGVDSEVEEATSTRNEDKP